MTNKLISLLSGLFISLCLAAQVNLNEYDAPDSPAPLLERVARFGKAFPQEKAFLHLDNSCYFLGDTIWFKAYVTRTDSRTPTNLSKLLYVELMTPDGYLCERKIIPLENGSGKGAIVLADSLYGGFYELRAYTRWMLNFGRTEHPHSQYSWKHFYNRTMYKQFFRDYEKLYSRVFPVYDKPDSLGDYAKDMTRRPMRRYFKTRTGKEKLDVRFYPEGGNLVAGTTGRIAFEANDEEGRHIDISMEIKDKGKNTVAQAACQHRGRGTFDLPCPVDGKGAFQATFTYKNENYSFPLPDIAPDGCALRVEREDEALALRLTPHGVKASRLGISAINSGLVVAYREFVPQEGNTQTVLIPLKELPTGVNQLTVFDRDGRIYADRLCFVNHHDYDGYTLPITGAEKEFAPFSPIELEVSLPEGSTQADLSLTVRDAATDERLYDNGNMLTEMLLGSELKGFVEDPMYYFEADDDTHRTHLDLLMMVQGWRRYTWRDMAGLDKFQLEFMPEKQQMLAGSVHNTISYETEIDIVSSNGAIYDRNAYGEERPDPTEDNSTATESGAPDGEEDRSKQNSLQYKYSNEISALKKEVLVKAEYHDAGDMVLGDQVTKKGKFYMPMPKFYEYCTLFLSATDTTQHTEKGDLKRMKDFKNEEAYPEYYVKQDLFYPQFTRPYSFYEEALPDDPFNRIETNNAGLTDRELPVVTIRTKRGGLRRFDKTKPAFVIDALRAYNHVCDWGLMAGKYSRNDFVQALCMAYIGDMGLDKLPVIKERHDGRNVSHSTARPEKENTLSSRVPMNYITPVPDAPANAGGFAKQVKFKYLKYLDKIYIYTDYCPREQGSYKYEQDNQPEIIVDLRTIPLDGMRNTYRDRYFFPLPGLSVCEDFYSPDYSTLPPADKKDFRRTLLWMPEVQPGEDGKLRIKLYNNSKPGFIRVRVEGLTPDGKPLSGAYDPQ